MSNSVKLGRQKIAKLARKDGEHVFAREVLDGCWDHRNDVAAAIAEAERGEFRTRVRGYIPCRIVSKQSDKKGTVMVAFEDNTRLRFMRYKVEGAENL